MNRANLATWTDERRLQLLWSLSRQTTRVRRVWFEEVRHDEVVTAGLGHDQVRFSGTVSSNTFAQR